MHCAGGGVPSPCTLDGGFGMIAYIMRRILYSIVLLIGVSIIGFAVIQLPPGDYMTMYVAELRARGDKSAVMHVEELRARYGLDRPVYEQYWIWITHFVRGDFGRAFKYELSVREVIGQRLALTAALAVATMILTWVIAIPIGIYSATHQYSVGDQVFTTISFIGLGTPGFLLALILLFVSAFYFDQSIGGLFSPGFEDAPWSLAKFIDLLKHLWVPALITSVSGTAGLIRIMRANLLDTLGQPFVLAARAKGLKERVVILKHAVRIAINPLISILGMSLPNIISGAAMVSIVLNLPTTGPLFVEALRYQDMYLAGTMLMFLTIMLVVGNLLADIALVWVDPRIRYD
jgi:peptide/nickel transport system permease protein